MERRGPDWISGNHLYLLHHGAENTLCILPHVTCLICCGGCLWCCPLPDTFKASVFLLSLDFHHLHLLRDWEADGALCFQDTNAIVSLSAEISRAAVTVSNVRLGQSFRRGVRGVMMHVRFFCARIGALICVIRLVRRRTCIRAVWKEVSKIFWHPELNAKVPWSGIVQTKLSLRWFVCSRNMFRWNAFQKHSVFIQWVSVFLHWTVALWIACFKCLYCCPQPLLAAWKWLSLSWCAHMYVYDAHISIPSVYSRQWPYWER